jgi:hypothetical protein
VHENASYYGILIGEFLYVITVTFNWIFVINNKKGGVHVKKSNKNIVVIILVLLGSFFVAGGLSAFFEGTSKAEYRDIQRAEQDAKMREAIIHYLYNPHG